jgi:hypothetical protein
MDMSILRTWIVAIAAHHEKECAERIATARKIK